MTEATVATHGTTFETGAYRDGQTDKLDYEGFLSPIVLKRYAEYMHKTRWQSNGEWRDSDNWQLGIPLASYMKSMWRHFMSVWLGYRQEETSQEELCALLFNVMGMLHETIKKDMSKAKDESPGKSIDTAPRESTCDVRDLGSEPQDGGGSGGGDN